MYALVLTIAGTFVYMLGQQVKSSEFENAFQFFLEVFCVLGTASI